MRLSAPTQPVFLVSLVLFAVAVIAHFVYIPTISLYTFWLAVAAYAVLAIANTTKGL
jgi:hypothetical protein